MKTEFTAVVHLDQDAGQFVAEFHAKQVLATGTGSTVMKALMTAVSDLAVNHEMGWGSLQWNQETPTKAEKPAGINLPKAQDICRAMLDDGDKHCAWGWFNFWEDAGLLSPSFRSHYNSGFMAEAAKRNLVSSTPLISSVNDDSRNSLEDIAACIEAGVLACRHAMLEEKVL